MTEERKGKENQKLELNLEMELGKWAGMKLTALEEQGERKAVYDFPHTIDLRAYDNISIWTGAAEREDIWLDVILYPLKIGRPEFVEKAKASVCLPVAGGLCRIPFSAFDHSKLVSAHMKYISSVELRLRREKKEDSVPVCLRIEKIAFCKEQPFRAEALNPSIAGEAGERLNWKVWLENDRDEDLLLAVLETRHGRESFSLSYERKILLAPGERREVQISGVIPEAMAPGGFEERILQWIPCGVDLPGQSVTLYAGRRIAHPFLLHREGGWEYLRELLEVDTGLAEQFERQYIRAAKAFEIPEPAGEKGYVYISETQNAFLKTAIAWKLTKDQDYLDKLLGYFRGFLEEKRGYLSTQHTYFQFIRSAREWEKGRGSGNANEGKVPFAVHRACSAGWVQEGEFMTKMAMVYDLLYDRKEFTHEMHDRMELCMRAYMEFVDWRLTDGDGNNFQLAEASAAFYFACLLQDYPLMERFLAGTNGIYELMGAVFSDDGSYFEGATNYVRLAAEILFHAANACENCGLNLKDMIVPASCDSHIIHAPWARREEWAQDGKPFLGMSFERFVPGRKPVRRLKDFADQLTTLLTPEGILFSVNDSNEQSLIPILNLAYYLYGDSAYLEFRDPEQEGDFLFGLHMADWKKRKQKQSQGKGEESRLVEGAGFAILRERKEYFCQAVMKYGQHGGYHGHFDRLSLVSFIRDNQTFHNQEFAWYGYDSFLFKMWVQASVAHNMVVVDRRMQEPSPCECIYFEEKEDFKAVCAQTVCRWLDPPYGGQTPYPLQFPQEKCRKERRFILIPPEARDQGEIGEYSEPVFQRRLMVLMEGCLYIWDYLEAEHVHKFDCLYHPFGSVEKSGLQYQESTERFDQDPFGAGQFVTDCHWYEANGTVQLYFINEKKRVNPNDRIDFVKHVQLFSIFPPKERVMIGKYPGRSDHFEHVDISQEEAFLKNACRKTVAFHQEGKCAYFVTALEIGVGQRRVQEIYCGEYGRIEIRMVDGSRRRVTVKGMENRQANTIEVSVDL